MTWYNKDGSIQNEDVKETSTVPVWQIYYERERELPAEEKDLKLLDGEEFHSKDFE